MPSRRWMGVFALFFLMAGIGVGGGWAWWEYKQRPYRAAQLAYDHRDYPLALRWANWILRTQPRDLEALRLSARTLTRLEDYARAEQTFQLIPQLDAQDQFLLGLCYAKQKKYAQALQSLQQSLKEIESAEAHRILAVIHYEIHQLDLAIEHANKVLDDPAERDRGLALLGFLHATQGSFQEAAAAFDKLLTINPELQGIPQRREDILLKQAECLLKIGETERAATNLRKIPTIETSATRSRLEGMTAYQKNDFAAAKRAFQEALRQKNDDVETLSEWGTMALEIKEFQVAVDCFGKLSELQPNHPVPHQNLVVAYGGLGNTTAAVQHRRLAEQLRAKIEKFASPKKLPQP